jgi:VCBS repeat-containing protein
MPKTTQKKLSIFLCHASDDKPKVRQLYHRLISDGYDAWLDEESLVPGQKWKYEIPKAVRNSEVIIVCLSNKSISKEGYVQKEIADALDIADEKPQGTIFIIPARLEKCEVPERLCQWQWVDFFKADGYEKLRLALDIRVRDLEQKASKKVEYEVDEKAERKSAERTAQEQAERKALEEIALIKLEQKEQQREQKREREQLRKEIKNVILRSNVIVVALVAFIVFREINFSTHLAESFTPTNIPTLTAKVVSHPPLSTFILSATPTQTPSKIPTMTPTVTLMPIPTSSNTPTPTESNMPPRANGQSISVPEAESIYIKLTGSDEEGKALSYIILVPPSHGDLTGTAPNVTYVPAENYNGSDFFTFKVNDGALDSASATVDITVTSINNALVARWDIYGTTVDTALIISAPGILGNDFDVDGDTLTAIMVNHPAHGTLTLNANGSFTYMPDLHYNGKDSFTYKATDGKISSSLATVNIDINPINTPPLPRSQRVTIAEDTQIAITLTSTDLENHALTYTVTNPPLHGTLSGIAPNIVYMPSPNSNGLDSFDFKVSDGLLTSADATISITITPVNDAPIASNDTGFSVTEDHTLNVLAGGILENDKDVDGGRLTALLVRDAMHGSVTLKADGSFMYKPFANYNGPDSFTYSANDGILSSNIATVNLNVKPIPDAPVCVPSDFEAGESDGEITPSCTDADGDLLTLIILTEPTHGIVSVDGGKLIYTPEAGYHGLDSFIYSVNDGGVDSNFVSITISNSLPRKPTLIRPVNGETLPQHTLPIQWQFVWDAPPDPCHSIITINDPEGSLISAAVYTSAGERYEYVYTHATKIPNNKLAPWSWQVSIVCPSAENTSEIQTFWIARAPFDWERRIQIDWKKWIQIISAVLSIISFLVFTTYILSLFPVVVYFDRIALVLNKNDGITKFLVNIKYFDWLESALKIIHGYRKSKIMRKSEPAKQIVKINSEMDNVSVQLEAAINAKNVEETNALIAQNVDLLNQFRSKNKELTTIIVELQAKFDSIYERLSLWR